MTDKTKEPGQPLPGMTLQNKFGLDGEVSYQILRVTENHRDTLTTVLNDGLGNVLEISKLQPALEMVAMLNENSGEGIKYKLRGIKNKIN